MDFVVNAAVSNQVIGDEEEARALADTPDRRFMDGGENDPLEVLSERQFIQSFRLSKQLFRQVVQSITPFMQQSQHGKLTVKRKLLIALRFLATGSYQGICGSDKNVYVSQSTVSLCLHEVCNALSEEVIVKEWVKFPANMQELAQLRNRFENKYHFPGIVGCIDCTHVAIIAPPSNDTDYPEHIYVNRKGFHSLNVQLVCDESLRILNFNAAFPGSAHDARIWRQSPLSNLMEEIHNRYPNEKFFLIGDSGYPLRPWLQTPHRDPEVNTPEYRYNHIFCSIRSTIERCNGVLKSRFRCLLKHRVLHYHPKIASKITTACIVLHNMCIENNLQLILEDGDDDDVSEIVIDVAPVNVENDIERVETDALEKGREVRRQIMQQLNL